MKSNGPQKVKLGIFVTIGTIVLLMALFLIGQKRLLFSNTITLNAKFSNVNGLQLGNNVYYSGIKAGTVTAIKISDPKNILVQMHIDKDIATHIDKKAVASINLSGLVGNMIVDIIPSKKLLIPIISGDTIFTGNRISTKNMLTTLNSTNEKVEVLTDNLLQITSQILEGKGLLGVLTNDVDLADDVKKSIRQFKEASIAANSTLTQLNNIICSDTYEKSLVGVLLSDTLSGNKVKNLVYNLELSGQKMNNIATNLDKTVLDLNSNNGAVHFLSQDEKFVEDIKTSMQNIKEGTIQFNQNMEALKTHFLFRKYYKNLEDNNTK